MKPEMGRRPLAFAQALAPGVILIETQEAIIDRVRECGSPDELAELLSRLRPGGGTQKN